ncbi:hypothetical protein LEP1GSC133_2891 [Leptospira borgpetersenii serovar Pomona str. 200901868]|uniref:Uncharacterized protein n=1 Tax=Leptospira borgpetersenii serovar Pomona str. 200901868 TaxID=1192866 RepID=M6W4T5_LEPBO|nr:hypothetical protein LEP1GSC133_2891 [Leptospira borgpetersenii serovar Pomona str. 200901868]
MCAVRFAILRKILDGTFFLKEVLLRSSISFLDSDQKVT